MKRFIALSLLVTVFINYSCKKETPGYVDEGASFDAVLPVATVDSGDSVLFDLSGNPDVISFYSGEQGHNYDFRDRTQLSGGRLNVKFQLRVQNVLPDSIDVMLSNDFTGIYDSANVANAHWKNMNSFFVFPDSNAALSTFYPSGPYDSVFADITDSIIPATPCYFAFRYKNLDPSSIIWSVGKLGMYNIFTSGEANATVIDSNQITSGSFAGVALGDSVMRWSTSSTYLKMFNSSFAPLDGEQWYISRPLNPSAVTPDVPVAIKNITQNPLTSYRYAYSKPGTYKAVFVAKYVRLNYEKTIVKEFTVVVQ